MDLKFIDELKAFLKERNFKINKFNYEGTISPIIIDIQIIEIKKQEELSKADLATHE